MARRLFVGCLVVLAALDLLILSIRVADIVALGRLSFLPAEGPVLYAIWKVRHGYPLYEWPTRPYFVLTLYNVLFYKAYAAVLAALRLTDPAVPVAARFITGAFAIAGAVGQYFAVRRMTAVSRSFRLPLACLCVATWLGAALPGWWALSIRPDIPATAISTWGIAAALTAFSSGKRRWLAAAGFAFFIAWTFKQSQVALFAATCGYVVLWRRSIGELTVLIAACGLGTALVIDTGGAVYRANIFEAPRLSALVPYLALYWYRSVILTDLLLWGVALYAIVAIVRPGSMLGPPRSLADIPLRSRQLFGVDVTYAAFAAVTAGVAGAVLLAKVGSAVNHIMELNVAASLVCAAVIAAAWETPRAAALCRAGVALLAPMIAFQAALLWNDQGAAAAALQLKGWGTRVRLTTAEAAQDRERLAAVFATLPHPVFTDDEIFAQPWHATGNRYPTVILDHVFYDAARSKGMVGRGVEGLFADRYFAAAVVPDSSAFLTPAIRAGYRLAGTVPQVTAEPLRILLRDR